MKKILILFKLTLICELICSQTPQKIIAEQFSPITYLHSIYIDEKNNEMYVGKIEPKGFSYKEIICLTHNGGSSTVGEIECWYITAIAIDSIENFYAGAGDNLGKWKLLKFTPQGDFSTVAENLPEFGRIQFLSNGKIELSSDNIIIIDVDGEVTKTNRKPLYIDLKHKFGYRLDRWAGNYVIKYDLDENLNESNPDTVIYKLPYAHGITMDDSGTVYALGYQDNRNILSTYSMKQGEKRYIIDNDFYCPPEINSPYLITGLTKGKGKFGHDYLYILVASEGIYRLNLDPQSK